MRSFSSRMRGLRKKIRLYGIDNAGKSIDGFILDVNNVGRKSLDIALPEDFHSVTNVPRSFGLCGIAGKGNVKTAEHVDFFTGKAETSSYLPSANKAGSYSSQLFGGLQRHAHLRP